MLGFPEGCWLKVHWRLLSRTALGLKSLFLSPAADVANRLLRAQPSCAGQTHPWAAADRVSSSPQADVDRSCMPRSGTRVTESTHILCGFVHPSAGLMGPPGRCRKARRWQQVCQTGSQGHVSTAHCSSDTAAATGTVHVPDHRACG